MSFGGSVASDLYEGATSFFDEEWQDYGGADSLEGLGPVVEFNARSAGAGSEDIDHQPLYTAANSTGLYYLPFDSKIDGDGGPGQNNDVEQVLLTPFGEDVGGLDMFVLSPHVSGNTAGVHEDTNAHQAALGSYGRIGDFDYPPEFHQLAITPYFHHSIEIPDTSMPPHQHHHKLYTPLPFHHPLHRRSASEPPAGHTPDNVYHHHYPISSETPAEVTFHRPGHVIGTPTPEPQSHDSPRVKPSGKNKVTNRQHPYPTNKRGLQGVQRKKKHQFRDMKSEAMRAPTSVPSSPAPSERTTIIDDAPVVEHQLSPHLPMSPLQLVSSRICTPAPSPERVASPVMQEEDHLDSGKAGVSERGEMLAVPVSVEELRGWIKEAVREAVEGLKGENAEQIEGTGVDGIERCD